MFPWPPPTPAPTPTPIVWSGAPARSISLEQRPLGFDADGNARWLVVAKFAAADGTQTTLVHGANVDFYASRGTAQWQTRLRFAAPAAIVKTTTEGPLALRAAASVPAALPPARTSTDTRTWQGPRVVAKALGPHLVQIGWFPVLPSGVVRISRSSHGAQSVTRIAAPASTYRDATVVPGSTYRYDVALPRRGKSALVVHVPAEVHGAGVDALGGKGAWLAFSPSPLDDDAFTHLDPVRVVAQAAAAGLHVIQLRMAYGEFWEVTPDAKPTIDALIDLAAARGIGVVAWTIPREMTFADLALAVGAATYRTPHGTSLAGLAVDLERGEQYMGEGAQAHDALAGYLHVLRNALGHRYPIVAIVEDPGLGHLTNRDVPYRELADSSDALLPMIYWRALATRASRPSDARAAIRASVAAVRREAGTTVRILVGGQTTGLGPRGAPSPAEVSATLDESRKLGVLGEVFFDWNGTSAAQWDAIGRFTW